MESITLKEFNKQAGKALIILFVFMCVSIFRIIRAENNFDHIVIIIVSIMGIIGIRRLLLIAEQKLKQDIKLKSWESFLLEQILIFGLGILSIYVFAFKGIYGLYILSKDFSFMMLMYRVIIIIFSYQLVFAVSKIQTVFNSINNHK